MHYDAPFVAYSASSVLEDNLAILADLVIFRELLSSFVQS